MVAKIYNLLCWRIRLDTLYSREYLIIQWGGGNIVVHMCINQATGPYIASLTSEAEKQIAQRDPYLAASYWPKISWRIASNFLFCVTDSDHSSTRTFHTVLPETHTVSPRVMCWMLISLLFHTGFSLPYTLLSLPMLVWQSLSQLLLLITELHTSPLLSFLFQLLYHILQSLETSWLCIFRHSYTAHLLKFCVLSGLCHHLQHTVCVGNVTAIDENKQTAATYPLQTASKPVNAFFMSKSIARASSRGKYIPVSSLQSLVLTLPQLFLINEKM